MEAEAEAEAVMKKLMEAEAEAVKKKSMEAEAEAEAIEKLPLPDTRLRSSLAIAPSLPEREVWRCLEPPPPKSGTAAAAGNNLLPSSTRKKAAMKERK